MSETFLVDFDYQVLTLRRRSTRPKPLVRRGKAAIEVQGVSASDVRVAYRVQAWSLGDGRHAVIRHQGKLWWPVADRPSRRSPRDFLRELRAGDSDLFGRPLRDVRHEPERRRHLIHDGYCDTLALVGRRARDLLIVDDGLYAAGGVPFLVRIFLDSTPAHRSVPAAFGEIRIRPGDGEVQDWAVCHGRYYLPGHPPPKAAPVWSKYAADRARLWIETIDGDAVDPVQLRVDAAFRTAWKAIRPSPAKELPPGLERLQEGFAQLANSDGSMMLTAERYCALQSLDRFCERVPRLSTKLKRCRLGVQLTIAAVEESESDLRYGTGALLDDADEAGLACLATR